MPLPSDSGSNANFDRYQRAQALSCFCDLKLRPHTWFGLLRFRGMFAVLPTLSSCDRSMASQRMKKKRVNPLQDI
jgi:hypothetical protein